VKFYILFAQISGLI